jgi:hypothetical protein
LWRWKEKGGKDDLNKAIWFIRDMISEIEDQELQEELRAEETLLEIARKL